MGGYPVLLECNSHYSHLPCCPGLKGVAVTIGGPQVAWHNDITMLVDRYHGHKWLMEATTWEAALELMSLTFTYLQRKKRSSALSESWFSRLAPLLDPIHLLISSTGVFLGSLAYLATVQFRWQLRLSCLIRHSRCTCPTFSTKQSTNTSHTLTFRSSFTPSQFPAVYNGTNLIQYYPTCLLG